MTSEIKCPVCPYCDKLLHCNGTQYINERIVAMRYCQNPECEETEDLIGTRGMWKIVANKTQAKQDLEIPTDSESRRQITYTTDGRTKVYYGRNGTQIETNLPLPAGFFITIKEITNDK